MKVCWVILSSCPSSGKPNTPFQLEGNQQFGFSCLLFFSYHQNFLGEIWLGKNFTFLWKNPTDRKLPHSNISDLRDNQPCPCWLSVYLLPIIWKATALVLFVTAWAHLSKWESELLSCLKKACSLDVHSSCCCYSSRGVKRLLQDTPASRYAGFTWVNAAKKTLICRLGIFVAEEVGLVGRGTSREALLHDQGYVDGAAAV